ncbi:SIP domain-containing protein [Winogradskyella sediminis]|uniref:Oxidoreductase FAD-binding domain-containing protein n=1 Tax=Winogradskyella sediminis TaxID=1382466 RepID=A0A1H1WQ79_9FLAO|nr:SIP domain-containing protein [Winogradskyella sediminis]SDS99235.1 Oxidoreductase FAD-binding domain-containing protein [Winogradskyella sediminis]
MSLLENILKTVVLEQATIIEKMVLSKGTYGLRLQNDSIIKTHFTPGSFLRIAIGIGNEKLSMKDKIRSYSVWDIDKTEGIIDVAIATHSNGVGAEWVKNCKEGDTVYYKWKKGNFIADDSADSYIMVGDLSALSHLYMINRNIGNNKQIESLIYNADKAELFSDTDGSYPLNFFELPENPYQEIIAKLKTITPTLKGKTMAYIAGDSRTCLALYHFFRKELGWDTKRIKTKPFWNPEKKGLE